MAVSATCPIPLNDDHLTQLGELDQRQQFERFYHEYERLIRGVLFNMVDAQSVDDLVQEAFLKSWKGLSSFGFKSSLRTWIYRITMNIAIDHLRRRSSQQSSSLFGSSQPEPSALGSFQLGSSQLGSSQLGSSQLGFSQPLSSGSNGVAVVYPDEIERNETKRLIHCALQELEDQHRSVVVLFYFEGLAINEVAEVLGIPLGTVKSRLHMARERMKVVLQKSGVKFG